ncbi:tRNA pseudouridine(38-40) synthase TruA [Melioribacter sp. Ez-97]|uniref:tRNA pseudouridine(38-40) synthase TruA n=1 Tax=Melioribacter sp. Ez-97 TaxID=3423434 RepID=UPI003EDA4689
MGRFRLDIEYAGTRYSGWQKQKSGRTIQGKLIEAAEKIFKGEKVDLQGSGRTDAGVHALNQVAHLEVKTMLAPEIIKMKLNDLLPADINILEVSKAGKNFHARHDAVARSYIYQISRRRTAFGKQFVWWIKDDLDLGHMKHAGKLFEGMHDFASFADKDSEDKSTKVLVEAVQFKEAGDLILIRIAGSHFLWKMVRRMVGVLVETGRGKLNGKDVESFLNTFSREPARYTAPPSGLFLEKVIYEKNYQWDELEPVINLTPAIKFGRR